MEKSDTIKIEQTLDGLEYICLVGPMIKSFTPEFKHQAYICIDGGAHLKHTLPAHIPCLTVGDGDSYNNVHDISYPVKKDSSDFALALKVLPHSVSEIDLFGLRGGRRDHEFINIGEILRYLDTHSNLNKATFFNQKNDIKTDCWFALNKGIHSLNFKSTFSIISLQKQKISIEGQAEYKCTDRIIDVLTSQGLSNVANGEIAIKCQKPLLIMRSTSD